MEKNEHEEIIAFDTLYTTNHIAMLKIVMPYFDHPLQPYLAVYIKFLELQYALSFSRSHPHELYGCSVKKKKFDAGKICSDILPLCTEQEKQMIEQIAGLFRSMEMYQEMSQMMNMMKDIMPSNMSSEMSPEMFSNLFSGSSPDLSSILSAGQSNGQDNGMMDMLMGMLSPEQKNLFEMFGGNNTHESE